MAAVYAASEPQGGRVAIKFMHEHFRDDASMMHLFSREANVANLVGHPRAVPVLDCSVDDDGCAYLIMPLLEGETVRARWERSKSCLPLSEVGVITWDVLDVLATAHARGIVHRDIKPENLFILTTGQVHVLDFGIARRIDRDGSATVTGHMVGTPAFMPPEQALGDRKAIGPSSDCWSMGATVFALLSGELVHVADNAHEHLAAAATRRPRSLADVAPQTPDGIVRFVDRALAFEPSGRWGSAREMRDAWLETIESALGEPATAIAERVRAAWIAELSQETAPTRVKVSTQEVARVPVPAPTWSRYVQPDVEVRAFLPKGFGPMTPTASLILANHGLGQFTDSDWFIPDIRAWWPMEPYIAVFHELVNAVGPIKAIDLGKRLIEYATFPPDFEAKGVHGALALFDIAYHLNHRRGDELLFDVESGHMIDIIGHYHYRGQLDTSHSAVMEAENPYPCELDQGLILGFVRRFHPHAVIEHGPAGCRKDGAESCTYYLTWW
ncbi:serine/threonine protein kinase [Pendulispora brunnea]|uniref:Serine/threonine protein kinase n=2 Tax=Pendulispora brunnea TaxID=2905690 RepID=A0ABZ2KTH3_9BACT